MATQRPLWLIKAPARRPRRTPFRWLATCLNVNMPWTFNVNMQGPVNFNTPLKRKHPTLTMQCTSSPKRSSVTFWHCWLIDCTNHIIDGNAWLIHLTSVLVNVIFRLSIALWAPSLGRPTASEDHQPLYQTRQKPYSWKLFGEKCHLEKRLSRMPKEVYNSNGKIKFWAYICVVGGSSG